MSFWGSPEPGDHVRAKHDLSSGFMDSLTGSTSVPRGRRGIVRSVDGGWFSTRYTVEFEDGMFSRTVSGLRDTDLRRTGAHGERSWQSRRAVRRGVRLGLFAAFTLPALVALALFFLGGGTAAELIPALLEEAALLAVHLLSLLADLLGPVFVLAVAGGLLWLVLRPRRTG